jgi:hypothetical protein
MPTVPEWQASLPWHVCRTDPEHPLRLVPWQSMSPSPRSSSGRIPGGTSSTACRR